MSTYLGFDYRIHQPTYGGIRRPVEDYVLARITIQEHLAKLTEEQRRAVVMGACGFNMTAWAEITETSKSNTAQSRRRALANLAKEEPPPKAPVLCEDCGERLVTIKGMCDRCDARRRRRLAGIMPPRVKAVKPVKRPRLAVMCSECEAYPVHGKGLCKSCYNRQLHRMRHPLKEKPPRPPKPEKQPKLVVMCSDCGRFRATVKGLCKSCYRRRRWREERKR